MKRLFSLWLLIATTIFAQTASAQLQFGFKGGLNVSKLTFSQELFDSNNRAGWFAGPSVKFKLPIVGLSFDLSALYDERSATIFNSQTTSNSLIIKQQTVQVPLNLRLGFGLGNVASVFAFAGPQLGFNVGKDRFDWKSAGSYENTFQLKKSMLSVNVGAGVTLGQHLQLSANYNIANGKTGEASVRDVIDHTVSTISNGKANSWQIAAAYYF